MEQVTFQCAPENVDGLISAALDEIEIVKKSGVETKDLNKVKLAQKNEQEINLKSNNYWINEISKSVVYNTKVTDGKGDSQLIDDLNSKDLQKFAKRIFGANFIRIVLYPEKEKTK